MHSKSVEDQVLDLSLKMSIPNRNSVERLKNLREQFFNGKIEPAFIQKFYSLILYWVGPRPDLRDIFRPVEIELLLKDCVKQYEAQIVEFVASCGYKDQPQPQQQQLPLRRATPIHCAATHRTRSLDFLKRKRLIEQLFKIYDRYDVDYTDESGYSHFHAAVAFDLVDVVKKFLDLGRDPNLCVKKTGDSPLYLAVSTGNAQLIELLLRAGADPNRANKQGSTPLHIVAKHFRDSASRDAAKLLFELSQERYRPLRFDTADKQGNTPLHKSVKWPGNHRCLMELLLRQGADCNVVNKGGETPLYILCRRSQNNAMWPQLFFQVNDDLDRRVLLDVQEKSGETALHTVVRHNNLKAFELLLRRGADPNLANEEGQTALHLLCGSHGYSSFAEAFFSITDERQQFVQIDAQDKSGRTPLYLALGWHNLKAIELLLKRGADPNLPNNDGETPLHKICQNDGFYYSYDNLMDLFFSNLTEEKQQTVQIDARDNSGNTPLHLALKTHSKTAIEALLRKGADPNLTNEYGSTALHIVCRTTWYFDNFEFVKKIFRIIDEVGQSIERVDAQDKTGRTPLQWAVMHLLPNMVDLLLDRGADASSFVLPTLSDFDEALVDPCYNHRLIKVSGIMRIVESLEKRKYELDQSHALILMKVLGKYLFTEDPLSRKYRVIDYRQICWYHGLEDELKKVEVKPSLSLYDLIRLEPKEAAKLLSYSDYLELGYNNKMATLPDSFREVMDKHLCEKVSREFFVGWALEPFWALIHGRLPIDCCEMILRNLANKDLLNIFMAATGQYDKESEDKKRKFDAASDDSWIIKTPMKLFKGEGSADWMLRYGPAPHVGWVLTSAGWVPPRYTFHDVKSQM